jgi:hypothetical protein
MVVNPCLGSDSVRSSSPLLSVVAGEGGVSGIRKAVFAFFRASRVVVVDLRVLALLYWWFF